MAPKLNILSISLSPTSNQESKRQKMNPYRNQPTNSFKRSSRRETFKISWEVMEMLPSKDSQNRESLNRTRVTRVTKTKKNNIIRTKKLKARCWQNTSRNHYRKVTHLCLYWIWLRVKECCPWSIIKWMTPTLSLFQTLWTRSIWRKFTL